jgi:hypothetical protein
MADKFEHRLSLDCGPVMIASSRTDGEAYENSSCLLEPGIGNARK